MDSSAEVSIVIPTRNRRHRLLAAGLRSARMQEDVRLEILVVDDASTDGTIDALEGIEDVTLLRQPQQKGQAAARNRGLAAATAPWVAFLDDDDLWSPVKLRQQLAVATATGADLVSCGTVVVDDRRTVISELAPPEPAGLYERLLFDNDMHAGASSVMVRRELAIDVGGFDEGFSHLTDWDLWVRLCRVCRFAATEEVLLAYVLHGGNQVIVDRGAVQRELRLFNDKHRSQMDALGVPADRPWFDEWVAGAHRRQGRRRSAARAYMAAAWRQRDGAHAARAAGVLLGESSMQAARGLRDRLRGESRIVDITTTAPPAWLALYD